MAVLKRVCDDEPRPLREIHPEIPEWFEAIVFKLLAKEPADRFASAAEVADLLGRHLRHLQEPDAPAPSTVVAAGVRRQAVAVPAARPPKTNRAVWIVVACVLGVLVLCAGVPVLGALVLFGWVSPRPYLQPHVSEAHIEPRPRTAKMETRPAIPLNAARTTASSVMPRTTKETKPPMPPSVFDILTNKNAPQLAPLHRFCTIESATYSPKTRTLTWTGKTREVYGDAGDVKAEADFRKECGEFRFTNRQGRPLGRMTPVLARWLQLADGRRQVFIDLTLREEIVDEATAFEIGPKSP
jgi:hypothetical protein